MSCEAGAVRTAACPNSQPGSRGQPFCRCGAARSLGATKSTPHDDVPATASGTACGRLARALGRKGRLNQAARSDAVDATRERKTQIT